MRFLFWNGKLYKNVKKLYFKKNHVGGGRYQLVVYVHCLYYIKKSSIRQNGQIYLPIKNNSNNNLDYMGTYRIEPIQITNQETYINRPNFNEHHKATKKVIILDKNSSKLKDIVFKFIFYWILCLIFEFKLKFFWIYIP